jgi:recombinational DNA repair ATPase RecF
LALKISQYKRFCKEKNIVDKSLEQRLDLLQKQLAALSPAVYKDNANVNSISRIVNEIGKAVGNLKTGEENDWAELNTQFKNLVEDYIDEVQRIRTTSITLK